MCASFRFCVSVLTLPNGKEESVLAKTQRIFCSYSPLRMRSAFWKKSEHFFEKFLLPLTTGGQIPVWPKIFEISFLHLPPDMRCVFGSKFWNILSVTPIWRWVLCFSKGNRFFIWNFCRPRLHGRNVNPHYPLEVWSAFEQKTEKFLISLPISEKFIRIEPPLTWLPRTKSLFGRK